MFPLGGLIVSNKVWIPESDDLKDIPVLEGELEWVMSVIDEDQRKNRSDETQESDDSNLTYSDDS